MNGLERARMGALEAHSMVQRCGPRPPRPYEPGRALESMDLEPAGEPPGHGLRELSVPNLEEALQIRGKYHKISEIMIN